MTAVSPKRTDKAKRKSAIADLHNACDELVAQSLELGDLVRVDDTLPAQTLDIKMVRLRATQTDRNETIWQHLAKELRPLSKNEALFQIERDHIQLEKSDSARTNSLGVQSRHLVDRV